MEVGSHQQLRKGEDFYQTLETTIDGEVIHFLLVADGHGGPDTSLRVTQQLPAYIAKASDGSSEALHLAVIAGIRAVHDAISRAGIKAGSTVTVVAVNASRRELSVWNVGNSMGLLVGANGRWQMLGTNHSLSNADELRRVVTQGAKLGREKDAHGQPCGPLRAWPGGIAVARAVGNADCGDYMSAEPSWRLGLPLPAAGGALVVCSDGVWDRMPADKVAKVLLGGRYNSATGAATKIVEKATAHNRAVVDDTTAVVLIFGPALSPLAMHPTGSAPDDLLRAEQTEPLPLGRMAQQLEEQAPAAAPQSEWTVHDAPCLLADVKAGTWREACGQRLMQASSHKESSSSAARVLRSWRLLGEVNIRPRANQKVGAPEPAAVARTPTPPPAAPPRTLTPPPPSPPPPPLPPLAASARERTSSGDSEASALNAGMEALAMRRSLERVLVKLKGGGSPGPAMAFVELCPAMVGEAGADGETLLHVACRLGHVDLTESLLRRHVVLESPDPRGFTPLHSAANAGALGCASLLLQAGCDANARAKLAATPLILASTRGHLDIVRMLLEHDASVDAVDDLGMTAALYAKTYFHRAVSHALKNHRSTTARAAWRADKQERNVDGVRNEASRLASLLLKRAGGASPQT